MTAAAILGVGCGSRHTLAHYLLSACWHSRLVVPYSVVMAAVSSAPEHL